MSPVVLQALSRATELHCGQLRKDGKTPYVIHVEFVALLLARMGATDEQIAAGILHDTIEDTAYTMDELIQEFGEQIGIMVLACSHDKAIKNWEERNEELFGRLRNCEEAKPVKMADAMANLIDLVEQLKTEGPNFWKRFNAGREAKVDYFKTIADICGHTLSADVQQQYDDLVDSL